MSDLALTATIPAMTPAAICRVRELQAVTAEMPQVDIETQHHFHAGLYSRTIMVPAGTMIVGALIKIPTLLIVEGDARVFLGGQSRHFTGYNVFPASANRKQVFVAITDTYITMVFPTEAKTVEEAERQFTDEADNLVSRRDGADNQIIITGE